MKVCTDSCLFGAWVASEIQSFENSRLLDIGTGTGLLSLMIAQQNPLIKIDAIEIEKKDALQAAKNVSDSAFATRINVINEDIKTFNSDIKYDNIICNPPFFSNSLLSPDVDKNTAKHQSELDLKTLIRISKNLIKPTGEFFLLMPYVRYNEITSEISNISKIVKVRPHSNKDFFRIMIKFSERNSSFQESEINIKENGEYTKEFKTLLKNFYLDF